MNLVKDMQFLVVCSFFVAVSMASYLPLDDPYRFEYGVNSPVDEQNYGQIEHRNENQVKGEWYVHLPDGRLQRTKYYVDEASGFVAEVTYERPEDWRKNSNIREYVQKQLYEYEGPLTFNPFG